MYASASWVIIGSAEVIQTLCQMDTNIVLWNCRDDTNYIFMKFRFNLSFTTFICYLLLPTTRGVPTSCAGNYYLLHVKSNGCRKKCLSFLHTKTFAFQNMLNLIALLYDEFGIRNRCLRHVEVTTSLIVLPDVIIYPCPRYLLLVPKSPYIGYWCSVKTAVLKKEINWDLGIDT